MGVRDYLLGKRIELVSPLPPEEVKQRIRAASGWKLNPLGYGVKGGIFGNRLKMRWKVPLVNDWLSPRLVGKFEDEIGRTRLRANFVPSLRARLFLIVCSAISLVTILSLVTGWLSGNPVREADVYFLLIVAALFGAPVAVQAIANLGNKSTLQDMLDFLVREAGLQVDTAVDPFTTG